MIRHMAEPHRRDPSVLGTTGNPGTDQTCPGGGISASHPEGGHATRTALSVQVGHGVGPPRERLVLTSHMQGCDFHVYQPTE